MAAYIDTSAWIALLDSRDRYHPAAVAAQKRLLDTQESLVTGWHTLLELSDGLAQHTNQRRASATLTKILKSPTVHIEPSEPHLDTALELFSSRTDWEVDLSDCISFALMQANKIERAFTYDNNFAKAGFEMVG